MYSNDRGKNVHIVPNMCNIFHETTSIFLLSVSLNSFSLSVLGNTECNGRQISVRRDCIRARKMMDEYGIAHRAVRPARTFDCFLAPDEVPTRRLISSSR